MQLRALIWLLQIILCLSANSLYPGELLSIDEIITSVNGAYTLQFLPDGNLCTTKYIFGQVSTYWCNGATSLSPLGLYLDEDCSLQLLQTNLSSYNDIWVNTFTSNQTCHLILQDDANLVLYYQPLNTSIFPVWDIYYSEFFSPPSPSLCARENEECECTGMVYYGFDSSAYYGSSSIHASVPPLEHQFMFYRYTTLQVERSIKCSSDEIVDPLPGVPKYCLCASFAKVRRSILSEPVYVGPYSSQVECDGLIYYGYDSAQGDFFLDGNLSQMLFWNFTTLELSGVAQCGDADWPDPLPNFYKGCFCASRIPSSALPNTDNSLFSSWDSPLVLMIIIGTITTLLLIYNATILHRRREVTKARVAPAPAMPPSTAVGELWVIPPDDLIIESWNVLGLGGCGKVVTGVWRDAGRPLAVAVKMIHPHHLQNTAILTKLKQEANLLIKLRSPYTTMLYGLHQGCNLVLEMMNQGSLYGMIKTHPDRLSPLTTKVPILLDIIRGLEYLHSEGVIHADMKSPNILLCCHESGAPKAKISDFGISHVIQNEGDDTTTPVSVISFRWVAPELLEDSPQPSRLSKAADIYSYGIIVWEVFALRPPLADLRGIALIHKILSGERDNPPPNTPSAFIRIIATCCEMTPSQRPSASVIRQTIMQAIPDLLPAQQQQLLIGGSLSEDALSGVMSHNSVSL
jgi:serine/threonine protein kinase